MASTRVVFPWSTCATIAMLRMEVLVIYTWGTSIVARWAGGSRDLARFDVDFGGLWRGLEHWPGRGEGFVISFIGRDGAKGGGGFDGRRGGLGFVWLYANAQRPEELQLFE